MRKKAGLLLLLLMAVGALIAGVAMSGCTQSESSFEESDFVDYYGCPNSRRVRKLNLKKEKRS